MVPLLLLGHSMFTQRKFSCAKASSPLSGDLPPGVSGVCSIYGHRSSLLLASTILALMEIPGLDPCSLDIQSSLSIPFVTSRLFPYLSSSVLC